MQRFTRLLMLLAVFLPSFLIAAGQDKNVVERLQPGISSVTVSAPEQLLLRAALQAEASAESAGTSAAAETVEQPEEPAHRARGNKVAGYRVQIYADNNVRIAKNEARYRERAIGEAFPQWSTYVTYSSPYWRLRIGDFRSQYDAEKAAAEIKKAFPNYSREVRVVRDQILHR